MPKYLRTIVHSIQGDNFDCEISLYFLHSKLELESKRTGVGYKIPPQLKFMPGVTLRGFYWRLASGGIFPGLFDGRASVTFPSSADG